MATEVDFSLLDGTIDDLADLKAFLPFPKGSYLLETGWSEKDINGSPAVVLKLKCLEVIELSDAQVKPPEVGATTDIAFILKKKDGTKNEVGEGQFKEVLKVLGPVVGGATLREVMKNSEGFRIAATLGVRVDKNDSDKQYNGIKSCAIPE